MDQKATSVADLALVLSLQDEIILKPMKALKVPQNLPKKLPRRLKKKIRKRGEVVEQLRTQQSKYTRAFENRKVPGSVTFSKETMSRIETERQAETVFENLERPNTGVSSKRGESKPSGDSESKPKVIVAWADIQDALQANWPVTVQHYELESRGGAIDKTVHVIGNVYQTPEISMAASSTTDGGNEPNEPRSFASTVVDTLRFWKR